MVVWLLVDQSWAGLVSAGLLLGLLALAWLDVRSGLLPDALTGPLTLLGVGLGPLGWTAALSAAISTWAVLTVLAWGYRVVRGQDGFGGGDIKLLALLAAWLGLTVSVLVLWLACLLGLLWWVVGRGGRRASYPFGPGLALAALPWVLAGPHRSLAAVGFMLAA